MSTDTLPEEPTRETEPSFVSNRPYDWSSPHALTFSSFDANLLELGDDGHRLTARHEMACCAALGSLVLDSGVHSWSVTIELSRLNYGGAICIGCADADSPFTHESGGPAWGFNPYSGALMSTNDSYKVDYSSPGKSLMMGDLQGKSNGAVVTMIIEMGEAPRSLYFSVNGGAEVMADVELPERVRPWVHLFKRHDALTISSERAAPARRDRGLHDEEHPRDPGLASPQIDAPSSTLPPSERDAARREHTPAGSASLGGSHDELAAAGGLPARSESEPFARRADSLVSLDSADDLALVGVSAGGSTHSGQILSGPSLE